MRLGSRSLIRVSSAVPGVDILSAVAGAVVGVLTLLDGRLIELDAVPSAEVANGVLEGLGICTVRGSVTAGDVAGVDEASVGVLSGGVGVATTPKAH